MIRKIFESKFLSVLMILTLLLPCLVTTSVIAAGPYPYTSGDPEVSDALGYLRGQQGTDGEIGDFATSAWVVMAIVAAGEDPHSWKVGSNPTIVDYLEANAGSASSTNDYSRMILTIAAADEDVTDFGGVDFLSQLQAAYDGSQIGDSSLLNDDFWGVMALVAAGEDPTTSDAIMDSISFILSNHNSDGGWSWGVGQDSDVDDTAAAIMALIAAGEPASSTPITDALDYIKANQLDNGGLAGFDGTSSNSATDSWGTDAIIAAGEDPTDADWESGQGNNPVDDLLTFQNADGSFDWTEATPSNRVLMTAYAIPALLGTPYPVAILPPQQPEEGINIDVRIEGENDTIWSGSVTVTESTIVDDDGIKHYLDQPTALGALDEASQEGNFFYVVQDTAYGLYLYSVDDEEPEGLAGWMYRVNFYSPMVGAADFILDDTSPPNPPHEEVLFYYGEWGQPPLKVEVDNTTPDVGETFTVTVTEYDDNYDDWSPTEDATVYADLGYTTDEDGEVEIAIEANATVKVYAEKDGYIRSNQVTVVVGEGSTQPAKGKNVTMTVDIIPAISFSVTPDYINFGLLGPRDISPPVTIKVTNEGAWKLLITAMVSDNAEDLYVDGLKLDNVKWDEFKATVSRDKTEEYVAVLTVPETYRLTGNQNGTIIFWASEAP